MDYMTILLLTCCGQTPLCSTAAVSMGAKEGMGDGGARVPSLACPSPEDMQTEPTRRLMGLSTGKSNYGKE